MGKGFRGRSCVYCLNSEAEDGDHVISRQFFPIDKRASLPKVPACKRCNNEKSQLEHELTATMPFGARHTEAGKVMEMVPARLAKNKKLHTTLAEGISQVLSSRNGGPWTPSMTLPFDGVAIVKLFEFIIKGLAWHHWKITLGSDHFTRASFVTAEGRRFFDPMFAGGVQDQVKVDLGDGVFVYEGVQSKECPELTLWRMTLYGAEVSGDLRESFERCSLVYGITVPKKWPVAKKLLQILST